MQEMISIYLVQVDHFGGQNFIVFVQQKLNGIFATRINNYVKDLNIFGPHLKVKYEYSEDQNDAGRQTFFGRGPVSFFQDRERAIWRGRPLPRNQGPRHQIDSERLLEGYLFH